ncbi:hypothetical protein BO70DRAFT_39445 [Aspergillus heteromorphus CBS 117.55]|uniref:Essential protein Yae1 N-terminal domain-containing protein n=1 Tax=Aspergillus heteromorphus CBS 117.55 TaxID=1448321 RepID=A0A317W7C3_9EURO|nr:uncharacterized protein BO70DRAFT_39445 [Aspergillus heteromorphus CBS 117.55]PWY81785.1 hypothetical protein BO70DRAFT_39445 [Aspergillus heteromorphus CBS 117.55]
MIHRFGRRFSAFFIFPSFFLPSCLLSSSLIPTFQPNHSSQLHLTTDGNCVVCPARLPRRELYHPATIAPTMESNLLESLLDLEEEFYQEGYDLGAADGAQAGYTEGSVFAVEKGFEKFVEMGRLYGKALVWAQRLADTQPADKSDPGDQGQGSSPNSSLASVAQADAASLHPSICKEMSSVSSSSRLAKNLDTLLELVDPASLAMANTEEAVNDVDERMKGAAIKAKLIQRALGEREDTSDIHPDAKDTPTSGDGTGSIEDISSLNIRH